MIISSVQSISYIVTSVYYVSHSPCKLGHLVKLEWLFCDMWWW